MTAIDRLERSLSYIRAESEPRRARAEPRADRHVVTISREAGTGAHEVGERCIELMSSVDARPWMLVDRDLVDRVLAEHGLPERLAASMPEDRNPLVADTLAGLLGSPDARTLAYETAETIKRLAEIGNVVVIGRGSNVVIGQRRGAYHVRLIGSPERRIARTMERRGLEHDAARAFVGRTDAARRRYVRTYYGVDVTDPLGYDVVVNMDRTSADAAARIIVAGVLARPDREGAEGAEDADAALVPGRAAG